MGELSDFKGNPTGERGSKNTILTGASKCMAPYGKTMENLRNRIDVTRGNEKDYLKWTSKPIYIVTKNI